MNAAAHKLAVKIIKIFEGVSLRAYPDPASDLYKALARIGQMDDWMKGKVTYASLPDNFKVLSGTPYTVGFGETKDVTHSTVWTQEQANKALEERVAEFMAQTLKDLPNLATQPPERIAAITSLAYNIGSTALKNSTVAKRIASGDFHDVPAAIKMWDKAGGKIMQGLVNRRKTEADLWTSVR
jgi:lysozyme